MPVKIGKKLRCMVSNHFWRNWLIWTHTGQENGLVPNSVIAYITPMKHEKLIFLTEFGRSTLWPHYTSDSASEIDFRLRRMRSKMPKNAYFEFFQFDFFSYLRAPLRKTTHAMTVKTGKKLRRMVSNHFWGNWLKWTHTGQENGLDPNSEIAYITQMKHEKLIFLTEFGRSTLWPHVVRVVMEESGNPCHPLVVWEHCCSDAEPSLVISIIC